MNKNGVEEQLKAIFTNVNDWLKFAETKNAALIAANAAVSFASFSILVQNWSKLDTRLCWYLISLIICALSSATIALLAIIPRTSLLISISKEKPNDVTDNLLFYGDIAKYKPAEFVKALKRRFGETDTLLSGLESDYGQQIVINSQIAFRKHTLFRFSAWLTISAIITPLIAGIIFFVTERKYSAWMARLKKDKKLEAESKKSRV
jgi:hypothetical protein